MAKEPHSVEETVEGLEELAERKKAVCVGDIVDEFGHRSFGPFLLIFALLELTPLGGVPGVPTALAVICAIIALQLLIGCEHVWIPGFIEQRSIGSKKLQTSAEKLEGIAQKLDHVFHGRLKRFTSPPWQKLAAVMILLLCVTVPPLEFLPFASSAPMVTIAAFGLALTVRDGLLMLVASVLSVVAIGMGTWLYWTSDKTVGGGGLAFF